MEGTLATTALEFGHHYVWDFDFIGDDFVLATDATMTSLPYSVNLVFDAEYTNSAVSIHG